MNTQIDPKILTLKMFYECPFIELEKTMKSTEINTDKTLMLTCIIYSEFGNSGLNNTDNIESLIYSYNKKDFKKTMYRLPITVLLLLLVTDLDAH